jgi:hypothetical protein
MKNEQLNIDAVIQTALQGKSEMGRIPVFDPANFDILKPANGYEVTGFYLCRWDTYKEFYKLDQKLKGNGYMLAGNDGIMYLLPDWKSLENKMKTIEAGQNISVVVVEITTNEKEETFIKTAVFRN